jgi:serine/threonine protein kinase
MNQDSLITSNDALFAGRYRIEKLLGSGAAGKVYLAVDTLLEEERVAIKVLSTQHLKDETQVKRFLREASLTRKVTHQNVVRTYDVGTHENILFLSMEYIEGVNLKEYIAEQPLDIEKALQFISSIGKGLIAIHQADIIHRDLKLNNVLITADDTVKIADFGVAKHSVTSLTMHDELIGSATHMAPEVWKGDVSPASDVYALGVILYELITGILPFDGGTVMELMWKHNHQVQTKPSEIVPEIPRWVDILLEKMLAKDPANRFANVEQVVNSIEEGLQQNSKLNINNEEEPLSLKRSTSIPGYERYAINEVPQVLWDPIRVEIPEDSNIALVEGEPQKEVKQPAISKFQSLLIPVLKPTIIFLFLLGGIFAGSYLLRQLAQSLLSAVKEEGTLNYSGPLIEMVTLSLISSLPVGILCLLLVSHKKAVRLWVSTSLKLFGVYALVSLILGRMVVSSGYITGYSSIKATMIAVSNMQLLDFCPFSSLIPSLPTIKEFLMGTTLPASALNSTTLSVIPWYIIICAGSAVFIQLFLLSTIISHEIFKQDSKAIFLVTTVLSLFISASLCIEIAYAKQISQFFGCSLNSPTSLMNIPIQLSPYELYFAFIHWTLFFISLIAVHLAYRMRRR